MKDASWLSAPGEQYDPATRTSEARMRTGSAARDTAASLSSPAPTAEITAELLRRLTNEIADLLMVIRPALDDPAQNDALLAEQSQCMSLASRRLSRYVEDVNTLVGQAAVAGPTSPLPVIEDLIDRLVVHGSWNVRFSSRLAPDLWEVSLSPNEIVSICRNLLDNAATATLRGGDVRLDLDNVRLHDSALPGVPAGDYLRIRVTDCGVGMSELVLARAKEPFFTTWGRWAHWRGLGLTQVETLCRRGGGWLALRSSPGHGTVATALLRRSEHRALPYQSERLERAEDGLPQISDFLVVDDDPLVLAALSRELTDRGCRVQLAQDVPTALAILNEAFPCGIVVLDLDLGQQSGLELARDIVEHRPDLRLVLTSGFCTGSTLVLDQSVRSQLYHLSKPFDVDDLFSLLTGEAAALLGR